LTVSAISLADWNDGQSAKWIQLPDLSMTGMDVRDWQDTFIPANSRTLADDWKCWVTGAITNIHIWGSWKNDDVPEQHAGVSFVLAIHADIPAGVDGIPYSRPGAVLWTQTFAPGAYQWRVWQADINEWWHDPYEPNFSFFPGDHICFQYNFPVLENVFEQQGTYEKPVIYWLEVQAILPLPLPMQPGFEFGWKTSTNHWNDCAVFATAPAPHTGSDWQRILTPPLHQEPGQIVDLAFVIQGEEPPPPVIPEGFKWLQPPDLSTNGFDVACQQDPPILLADDFACTNRAAITNIIVWGSWTNDFLPVLEGRASPSNTTFTLSFHADRPKGTVWPWSIPGPALWIKTFAPGTFTVTKDSIDNLSEGWYDPATSNWAPNADWTCWRYEFPVDTAHAFVQTGTVANPVIYWLDVQAQPHDETQKARFGWKSTPPNYRWNDDACWTPNPETYNGIFWYDMHYPASHPYHELPNNSFDLAFALQDGPEEFYDFGDAPENAWSPGGVLLNYPVTLANNGAYHTLNAGTLLGAIVDPETDGQPTLLANGDDINPLLAPDDEDGVLFTTGLYAGMPAGIQVTTVGAGFLSAWLDVNQNGNWGDAFDRVITDLWLAGGVTNVVFNVPPTPPTLSGNTYMRFRFSSIAGLSPQGSAPDGEVEDYHVPIEVEEEQLDFGDAPATYPTLLPNGARHVIDPRFLLGVTIDAEANGQPSPDALLDDMTGMPPDEDGVLFTQNLVRGSNVLFKVTASTNGYLSVWLDSNRSGNWENPGERLVNAASVTGGVNDILVAVPSAATLGRSFLRFRYTSLPGAITPWGGLPNGEVEDYAGTIYQAVVQGSIVITNMLATQNVAHIWWRASNDTETLMLICSNLASNVWTSVGAPSTARHYQDDTTAVTARFYRITAPFSAP